MLLVNFLSSNNFCPSFWVIRIVLTPTSVADVVVLVTTVSVSGARILQKIEPKEVLNFMWTTVRVYFFRLNKIDLTSPNSTKTQSCCSISSPSSFLPDNMLIVSSSTTNPDDHGGMLTMRKIWLLSIRRPFCRSFDTINRYGSVWIKGFDVVKDSLTSLWRIVNPNELVWAVV